jgi:hypothetical protein
MICAANFGVATLISTSAPEFLESNSLTVDGRVRDLVGRADNLFKAVLEDVLHAGKVVLPEVVVLIKESIQEDNITSHQTASQALNSPRNRGNTIQPFECGGVRSTDGTISGGGTTIPVNSERRCITCFLW